MPYSPAYSKVTFSSGEQASSTKQNQQSDNIEHNYKYKPELGSDAPSGIKLARGKKSVTIPSTSSGTTVSVNFAADSMDGDPAFNNIPVINVTADYEPVGSSSFSDMSLRITNATKTGFDISLVFDGGHLYDDEYIFHWMALGD